MASKKIESTKNYRMFHNNSGENRPLDIKKHRKLMESMKLYGFLDCYPIIVYRDASGQWVVKEGQHRLAIAESLGLPVCYVETAVDFDIAIVNNTQKTWSLIDYARKYAASGVKPYQEGLEFMEQYVLPVSKAFSLLAGTAVFHNCAESFYNGTFKIKDRPWANTVAGIYAPLVGLSKAVKNDRMIEACMAVCRVPEFDSRRLLSNAERCREKLVSYTNRDSYLQTLEEIYNFGRKQLFGLKIAAVMAMRERNPAKPKTVGTPSRNHHPDTPGLLKATR
jgi:hypothetical protein